MTSSHTNYFTLLNSKIVTATFTLVGYDISPGQPWGGVTVNVTSDGVVFDVEAGRHKTNEVAKWYDDQCRGGYNIGADTLEFSPNELNFAFVGQLYLTTYSKGYYMSRVVIAQGHNMDDRNNWYIGGDEFIRISYLDPLVRGEKYKGVDVEFKTLYGEDESKSADRVNIILS